MLEGLTQTQQNPTDAQKMRHDIASIRVPLAQAKIGYASHMGPRVASFLRRVPVIAVMVVLLSTQGIQFRLLDAAGQSEVPLVHTFHTGSFVQSIGFSGNGRLLASGGQGYNTTTPLLKLWDVRTGQLLRAIGENGTVAGVALSRDGKSMVSVSLAVKLWDTATGRLIRRMALENDATACCDVAMSPDGTLVTSAEAFQNHQVLVWDVRTGTLLRRLGGKPYYAGPLAFSPDGRILAVAAVPEHHPAVDLWDVRTGRLSRRLLSDHVTSLAYSPDGATLATVMTENAGHTLVLWDVRTGQEISSPLTASPGTLDGEPLNVAYWPRGPFLALIWSEYNGPHVVIRFWDSRRQATVLALRHDADLIAFSPDGSLLAAAVGSDITLWSVGDVLTKLR